MKELFIQVNSDIDEDGVCLMPLQSLIVLLLYKYCDQPPLLVTLVRGTKKEQPLFRAKLSYVLFDMVEEADLESPASTCMLPVIVTCEGTTCVAGLCAVLRQILKSADLKHPLLGFKQSCLYACAEASLWTQFCEVDIVQSVNREFNNSSFNVTGVVIPEEIARFEMHMAEPVRVHNIGKQRQDRVDCDLQHVYAEGLDMSLADMVILPCIHLIILHLGSVFLQHHIPLTYQWYEHMVSFPDIAKCLKIISDVDRKYRNEIHVQYVLPTVSKQSLYKSDPKRYKPRHRIYTRQDEIETCLQVIQQIDVIMPCDETTFGRDVDFAWNSVPFDAQPEGGELPEKRLERKSQQLENMTKAVLKIAKHGNRIVDFCSGSGHLGLILAHALPRCTVVLLENKEESLGRARARAQRLKLSNVIFCQSNIDYFKGELDIGVSLHACGVATDLVLQRCVSQHAAFVCCPCCYGSIQPNHMVQYPCSKMFRESPLTLREYLVVGHCSDQTHDEKHVKTEQGNTCMAIIDTDRLLMAQEEGYVVSLSKLDPPTCTPKNNLLVGIPSNFYYN